MSDLYRLLLVHVALVGFCQDFAVVVSALWVLVVGNYDLLGE
jgi:hypothetical protein